MSFMTIYCQSLSVELPSLHVNFLEGLCFFQVSFHSTYSIEFYMYLMNQVREKRPISDHGGNEKMHAWVD